MSERASSLIGIDVGGTNLRGALIGADGEIMRRFRVLSDIHKGRESFLERLVDEVRRLQNTAASLGAPIQAVGVGVPGLIDRQGWVHSSVNMPALEGIALRDCLEQRLELPVRCANDANLIALGEFRYGSGRGFNSVLVVTLGTGVGSGLILNGQLWEGTAGFAAEFGHTTVNPDGHPCPCGNCGCLEQYVSATALSRFGGGRAPELLASLARGGDEGVRQLFQQAGIYLGIALAGLLNTLNLDGIVIGGGVSASYDLLEPALTATLHQRTFPQILRGVQIRRASLGDDAGLLGAALLAAA